MSPHHPEESGTFFLLPPHHRLFAVFDDPVAGEDMAEALRAGNGDDVWTFYGRKGVQSLDTHLRHHGIPVAMIRTVQRLMTNDCEYCDGLSAALGQGAMVLAVRVESDHVGELSERLRQRGGHTFAYGEHWNFVPLRDAEQSVGVFTSGDESPAEDRTPPTPPRPPAGP